MAYPQSSPRQFQHNFTPLQPSLARNPNAALDPPFVSFVTQQALNMASSSSSSQPTPTLQATTAQAPQQAPTAQYEQRSNHFPVFVCL